MDLSCATEDIALKLLFDPKGGVCQGRGIEQGKIGIIHGKFRVEMLGISDLIAMVGQKGCRFPPLRPNPGLRF